MESPYLQYLDTKYRFPRSLVHRRIQRYLRVYLDAAPAGTRVLDAGCGTGIETGPYAGRLRVVGLDYQREYIACGAERYPAAHYAIADLSRLPVAGASCDLVIMNQVIEHLDNPVAVIGELARVMTPGGRLIVATPNYGGWGWPLVEATYHRWFSGEFNADENHVMRYRAETLRTHLSSSLVVDRVEAICTNLILVAVAHRPATPN